MTTPAFVIGCLVIAMAFVVPYMGELVLQVALSIFGMVGGPLAGLAILALFVPCCNSWVRTVEEVIML